MRDHDGRLPEAFADLTIGGYLRAAPSVGPHACFGPPARQGEVFPVYNGKVIRDIRDFSFLYGGHVDDFQVDGREVRRRETGEAVCFVAPLSRALLRQSREYTRAVVESARRARKR